jgi:ferritin
LKATGAAPAREFSPDMKWAVAMADRVKADREEIFQEHAQITDAMNALASAARTARDAGALSFAEGAVADSLNDIELIEPMTVVIGDYLRAKLPSGQ